MRMSHKYLKPVDLCKFWISQTALLLKSDHGIVEVEKLYTIFKVNTKRNAVV